MAETMYSSIEATFAQSKLMQCCERGSGDLLGFKPLLQHPLGVGVNDVAVSKDLLQRCARLNVVVDFTAGILRHFVQELTKHRLIFILN